MLHTIFSPDWYSGFVDSDSIACSKLNNILFQNQKTSLECMEFVVTNALRSFDQDNSLKGLSAYSEDVSQKVSPFLVTEHFCIRVLEISHGNVINLNISPVYHLNLDYPEMYHQQYGKELDPSAVLGLIKMQSEADLDNSAMFRYGIDLGIAFADSPVIHNHAAQLVLRADDYKLDAVLSCLQNVSMQVLSLDSLKKSHAAEIESSDDRLVVIDDY